MHLSRVWVVCSKTVLWSDALVLPAIGGLPLPQMHGATQIC